MKKLFFALLLLGSFSIYAQNNPTSVQGLDFDEYTTTQLNALGTKEIGDIFFDSTLGYHVWWDGDSWERVSEDGSGGGGISDGDKGDITVTSSGTTWIIDNSTITNSKLTTMANSTMKGRVTTGSGEVEDLSATAIRGLLNIEEGAAQDQTDNEIEIGYNNQVSIVSQSVAETGTSTVVVRWTPERINQAILALAPGGGGGITASSTDDLTNKTMASFTNDIYADHVHEELRNESGLTLTIGDAVYISGYSVGQNLALVQLADSDASGTMPSIAILADATLGNNQNGKFIEVGTLMNMDTSFWSVGDPLYISGTGTTGNTLTNTKPIGTGFIQKIGEVLRSHASLGVIEVFGAGRTNDLPNIPEGEVWVGNASGVPVAKNLVEADISDFGNYVGISGTETITGAKTFDNNAGTYFYSGGNQLILVDTPSGDASGIQMDEDRLEIHLPINAAFDISFNGTSEFNINEDGEAMFGTGTATEKVDVNGSINITGDYKVNGVAIGTGSGSGDPDQTIALSGTGNGNLTIENENTISLYGVDGIDDDNIVSDISGRANAEKITNYYIQPYADYLNDGPPSAGVVVVSPDAPIIETFTGTAIDMSSTESQGDFSSASSSGTFTMADIIEGGFGMTLVNRTGQPTVTGASLIDFTASWTDGEDMVLCVKDFKGVRKFWWFKF